VKHLTTDWVYFARFITRQEEGFSVVEYAILLALVAVLCFAAISAIGNWLSTVFNSAAQSI